MDTRDKTRQDKTESESQSDTRTLAGIHSETLHESVYRDIHIEYSIQHLAFNTSLFVLHFPYKEPFKCLHNVFQTKLNNL